MPAKALPQELPEGYYLENFNYLLDFVARKYEQLLTAEEERYYRTFRSLHDDAQKLYVRLTNRKGPYFRVDKLNYREVPDLAAAIDRLGDAALIARAIPELDEAIGLCSKDELLGLECFKETPRTVRRGELVDQLTASRASNPFFELKLDAIEVLGIEHLTVFKLLFFGNFHQDMTEFVLHELVAPFESYDLHDGAGAFHNREVVDEAIALQVLSERSRELVESEHEPAELIRFVASLPERSIEPMLARRFDRIINRLGRHLERLDCLEAALAVYQLARATPSRERQSRIQDKLGKQKAAVTICEEIQQAPLDEAEWEFALGFGNRLVKKHRLTTHLDKPDKCSIDQLVVRVPRVHDRVELCALEHYNDQGGSCFYVENTLFRSLFGLCFWDIIFAPVPGAFFHPFQRGPADLYTADFVASRKDLVDARLTEIDDPLALSRRVFDCFNDKMGIANQFVNWTCLDETLLELSMSHIPGVHLRIVFERLLVDLKNNASGFPDLIVFDNCGYRLIEIKGPGDKIQKNQERWFRYFNAHQIPAELVNVEYVG